MKLNWLPTQGYVSLRITRSRASRQCSCPRSPSAIAIAAPILRILRSSLADVAFGVLHPDGRRRRACCRRQVVLRHLLPNATIPALTMVGVIIGSLLGGTVIVEYVFARPGLGTLMVDAVYQARLRGPAGARAARRGAFILSSLLVDLLYGVIDPRLRVRGRQRELPPR